MKMKLLASVIVSMFLVSMVCLAANVSASNSVFPEGMKAYWEFDENEGIIAYDSLGAYDGTITNPNWVLEGKVGSCIQSSPKGATYTSVPNSPINDVGEHLTIEAWVYLFGASWTEGQGNAGYVAYNDDQGGLNVGGWWGGYFQFTLETVENGWKSVTSLLEYDADKWYHMVGVYNGIELQLYVDGVLINTEPQSGTIVQSSQPFYMGRYPGPNSFDGAYYGKIDEVAIYNLALTTEEIEQHYENGLLGLGYEIVLTPQEAIVALVEDVYSMNLQQGIETSIDAKLENVLDSMNALNADNRADAINKLEAFINAVEGQSDKKLTIVQADYLIAAAQQIIDQILEG